MAQQLSLDTTFSTSRRTPKSSRTTASEARYATEDEMALDSQLQSRPRQGSDKLRLVGLAGVARAREALAEATKRAEQRHLHQAA